MPTSTTSTHQIPIVRENDSWRYVDPDELIRNMEQQGYVYDANTNTWRSPDEAYDYARSLGYTRAAAKSKAGWGLFLLSMANGTPDYDYIFDNLRASGMSRSGAKKLMKTELFWTNMIHKYGNKGGLEVALVTQPTETPWDRMDRLAREHELNGDIYNPETNTWTSGDTTVPETNPDDFSKVNRFKDAWQQARDAGLKLFKWRSTKANPSGIFTTEAAGDNDNFSSMSFKLAFNTARNKGLKLFTWRKTKANPSGLFTTEAAKTVIKKNNPLTKGSNLTQQVKTSILTKTQNRLSPTTNTFRDVNLNGRVPLVLYTAEPETVLEPSKNPVRATFSATQDFYPHLLFGKDVNLLFTNWFYKYSPQRKGYKPGNVSAEALPGYNEFYKLAESLYELKKGDKGFGYYRKFQQGGKMDLKELQKQFTAYLIQQSGALSEAELEDFILKLGEDGLRQLYQKFILSMLLGTQSAKHGAKLNYIKSLRGKCPDGYELGFFKEGGKVCAKCIAKLEKQGAVPFTPMQGEKGTKLVQDFKKDMKAKKNKINLNKKKTEKKELGGIININQDLLDAFKCGGKTNKAKKNCKGGMMCGGGLVKKSNKVPIKQKFINSDKCGGKAKKKKCLDGGPIAGTNMAPTNGTPVMQKCGGKSKKKK